MTHTNTYRAIWISDVHLGTRGCKAESLVSFLKSHFAEKLYLIGDIVDAWREGPGWFWSSAQQAIADEIAGWRKAGADVIFLPGNHDEHNPQLVERNARTMVQERFNTEWIAQNRFGIVLRSFTEIVDAVSVLSDPEELARFRLISIL